MDERDPRPAAAEMEDLQAPADYDVALVSLGQWELVWRRFKRHRMAILGSALFFGMVLVGIVGPLLLPYDLYTIPEPDEFVSEGRPPSLAHPFGETGGLQWDVLTLVVNGARLSLVIGVLATIAGGTDRQLDASTEASGPHVYILVFGETRRN